MRFASASSATRSASLSGTVGPHLHMTRQLSLPDALSKSVCGRPRNAKSTTRRCGGIATLLVISMRYNAAAARPRMDTLDLDIGMHVNGEDVQARVAARKTLADFLRDDLCLTGTHVGCEHGVCGACTVRLDGEVVRGCLIFAVQCDGSRVETIEGLSDSGAIADLQTAFQR